MKIFIKLLIIVLLVFAGCKDKKEMETTAIDMSTEISLEGMWKLKSGIWDNEDGTFLKYPEDSLTEGPAYNIYSKSHFITIAKAPKMDFFRSSLTAYTIEGDKIHLKTKVSNFDSHEGMEATWTFKVEGNLLMAEIGQNKEVWERVE